jgi:hypothetical protein
MLLLPIPHPPEEASCWLIGRYKDQTKLATDLRSNGWLQNLLTDNQVRLGLRQTDKPPVDVQRQKRYGATIVGKHHGDDFTAQRRRVLADPVASGSESANRRGDREENVRVFWATQTPQSHHIVEFNHLRELGVSREHGDGALDHAQLPCVLLAAEFHQRYISSVLKQTHGWSRERLRSGIVSVYSSLYLGRSPLFSPLWDVSKIILRAAGVDVT